MCRKILRYITFISLLALCACDDKGKTPRMEDKEIEFKLGFDTSKANEINSEIDCDWKGNNGNSKDRYIHPERLYIYMWNGNGKNRAVRMDTKIHDYQNNELIVKCAIKKEDFEYIQQSEHDKPTIVVIANISEQGNKLRKKYNSKNFNELKELTFNLEGKSFDPFNYITPPAGVPMAGKKELDKEGLANIEKGGKIDVEMLRAVAKIKITLTPTLYFKTKEEYKKMLKNNNVNENQIQKKLKEVEGKFFHGLNICGIKIDKYNNNGFIFPKHFFDNYGKYEDTIFKDKITYKAGGYKETRELPRKYIANNGKQYYAINVKKSWPSNVAELNLSKDYFISGKSITFYLPEFQNKIRYDESTTNDDENIAITLITSKRDSKKSKKEFYRALKFKKHDSSVQRNNWYEFKIMSLHKNIELEYEIIDWSKIDIEVPPFE